MTDPNWGSNTTQWLRGTGPGGEVVISSRVRLARNLAGLPFLSKCTRDHQLELEHRLAKEIHDTGVLDDGGMHVDIAAFGAMDRELLVERHLISRHHADADHPRGLAVSADETVAIMTNEEDHVRMQVLRSGLQLAEALDQINAIDDRLDERLDFAFHHRYGYLTACPTNVGTGLRVSVMLHLPALVMAGELEKVFRAAGDMHLAIRGFYGEGTVAHGDFFQLSNQTTLGKTESQIVAEFTEQVLPAFIAYEREAREGLARRDRVRFDDRIFRALATLQSARLMSSEEMMYLLSLVRLGVNMGRIDAVSLETINDLFLLGQPAHLQRVLQREMDAAQRAEARATFVRHLILEAD
jgi:protein arginine kinase